MTMIEQFEQAQTPMDASIALKLMSRAELCKLARRYRVAATGSKTDLRNRVMHAWCLALEA